MLSKLDANETDVSVSLNKNAKDPRETNKNLVHGDQYDTAPKKLKFYL